MFLTTVQGALVYCRVTNRGWKGTRLYRARTRWWDGDKRRKGNRWSRAEVPRLFSSKIVRFVK
ncbi:hypothetical protein E2C01_068455 [Portunus trituberculatus]|uniref:Uncharacterized protein n=1 Tax=Portunus trituberculatus TaxID=210409 RepID=A0A5B7HZH1_PORTR|nr:hypothetical protein [Portunus trituberculatus]